MTTIAIPADYLFYGILTFLAAVALAGLLALAVLVLAFLHHFAVDDRRHAEGRADHMQEQRDTARRQRDRERRRAERLMLADAPPAGLPPTETQRLPRIPHEPTYTPGAAGVGRGPSTDLVPARDAQLPMPVRSR